MRTSVRRKDEQPEQLAKVIKSIETELTRLGIRMTVFNDQVVMALSKGDKVMYTVEEAIKEQNERITAMERKIDILAVAVKKVAKAQGRLPKKQ